MTAMTLAPYGPTASAARRGTFETLDAMRGIAAIAVMFYHCRALLPGAFGFDSAYLAVDLFFALSGFVVAYAYDGKLATWMTRRRFVATRLVRFMPMIWLGVALGAAQALFLPLGEAGPSSGGVGNVVLNALCAALLLPSPVNASVYAIDLNPPQWSMLTELIVNIGFALTFARLRGRMLLAAVAISGLVLTVFIRLDYGIDHGWERGTQVFAIVRATFPFLMGVAICRYRHLWWDHAPRLHPVLILGAVLILLLAPIHGVAKLGYGLIFTGALSPALILLGARVPLTGALLTVGRNLATLSYPLYALHYPIYRLVVVGIEQFGMARPVGIAVMVALIPLSIVVGKGIDAPVRRYLNGFLRPLPATGPTGERHGPPAPARVAKPRGTAASTS